MAGVVSRRASVSYSSESAQAWERGEYTVKGHNSMVVSLGAYADVIRAPTVYLRRDPADSSRLVARFPRSGDRPVIGNESRWPELQRSAEPSDPIERERWTYYGALNAELYKLSRSARTTERESSSGNPLLGAAVVVVVVGIVAAAVVVGVRSGLTIHENAETVREATRLRAAAQDFQTRIEHKERTGVWLPPSETERGVADLLRDRSRDFWSRGGLLDRLGGGVSSMVVPAAIGAVVLLLVLKR